MAAKETIAIAGATAKAGIEIACKLAVLHYRLLLISSDKNKSDKLCADIKATTPNAEAEAIDCLKDGCWEADIIVLAMPAKQEEVAGKIREVATQKIVVRLILADSNPLFSAAYPDELQQLLPYSKLVTAFINIASSDQTIITGSDEEAVGKIMNIAAKAGFSVRRAIEL